MLYDYFNSLPASHCERQLEALASNEERQEQPINRIVADKHDRE